MQRKKGVAQVFFGRSESVRDIQFHPHEYFQFAAAYENGNVQIWDIRVPNDKGRCERQFTAHREPVLSIDFHPEEKNWLATSGRDKLIKVWDIGNATIKNTQVVQTISPVAQIKWRPQRKYHIASCSLLLDSSVNIWDIRRPFIPFAAFTEHKDCVSGIQWKLNDPQTFFTCSKDSTLYAHAFKDADRPADNANPVSVALDNSGHIMHASSNKISQPPASPEKNHTLNLFQSRFRRAPDRSEQFTMVTSTLLELTLDHRIHDELDMTWFTESARLYQLHGKPLEELCLHNAQVAESLNRKHVAQSWRILRLLFTCSLMTPPVNSSASIKPNLVKQDGDGRKETEGIILQRCFEKDECRGVFEKETGDTTSTVSESEGSDSDEGRDGSLANIARGGGMGNRIHSDLFFMDTDQETHGYEYDELTPVQNSQNGSLPEEALQLREDMEPEIGGQSPQHSLHNIQPVHSNITAQINTHQYSATSQIRAELLNTPQFTELMTPWKFKKHVCNLLQYYADRGDVQTAVSMRIVLGNKLKDLIDEYVEEQWFIAYIDLLTRFKLYSLANRIMKQSNHPGVEVINQSSTTIYTSCSKCSKPMRRAGWLCDRCTNRIHTCALCHQPVRGLYVWCQGCCHGGHVEHMRQWFDKKTYCPTGCGHNCEYT